jgi:hypothetical protein
MSYLLYAEVLALHRRDLLAEAERDRLGDEALRGRAVESLRARFGRLLHSARARRDYVRDLRRTRVSAG